MSNQEIQPLLTSEKTIKSINNDNNVSDHIYLKKYWEFVLVAIVICVVRVCSNAISLYNTAVLGDCGGIGQSVQYLSTGIFSLFFSKPLVVVLGCKQSFIICTWLYIVYIGCFLCAMLFPKYMWEFNIPGSLLNGIAESIWLIAQGVFYSSSVEKIIRCDSAHSDITVRSHLAAAHSTVYMGADTSLLVIATVAIQYFGNIYTFLGILVLCVMSGSCLLFFNDLDSGGSGDASVHHLVKDVGQTFHLLKTDRRLLLVSSFMMAYGSTNALVGTYITGVTITESAKLGESYVGSLSALSRLAGAASGPLYDFITVNFNNGQHWVMIWGCIVDLLCGLLVITLSTETLGLPFVAISYQLLWGAGRGVMENTFRLILADFFVDNVSSAFSYYAFAVSLWTGISYYFDDLIVYKTMGWGVLALGIMAALTYDAASKLQKPSIYENISPL